MINVGSTSVGGRVTQLKPERAKIELVAPVCTRVKSTYMKILLQ